MEVSFHFPTANTGFDYHDKSHFSRSRLDTFHFKMELRRHCFGSCVADEYNRLPDYIGLQIKLDDYMGEKGLIYIALPS